MDVEVVVFFFGGQRGSERGAKEEEEEEVGFGLRGRTFVATRKKERALGLFGERASCFGMLTQRQAASQQAGRCDMQGAEGRLGRHLFVLFSFWRIYFDSPDEKARSDESRDETKAPVQSRRRLSVCWPRHLISL